jgi:hypothetical protein
LHVQPKTWLSENVIPPHIDGYAAYHRFRPDRVGGGVSLYINRILPVDDVMLHEFQSFEYICKLITLNDGLQYCTLYVYHPPSNDAHNFLSDFNALLDELNTAYPQCDRWIVGGD